MLQLEPLLSLGDIPVSIASVLTSHVGYHLPIRNSRSFQQSHLRIFVEQRHPFAGSKSWRQSHISVAGCIHDEHVRSRHAVALAKSDVFIAAWSGKLEEYVSFARRRRVLRNVELEANIGRRTDTGYLRNSARRCNWSVTCMHAT